MGNTLDGFVYRIKNNDPELTDIVCTDEGIPRFGDAGATQFASALAQNRTVKTLDLGEMGIGDDGATKLALALVLNDHLSLLRLHRNKISDVGAEQLAKALRHNHKLTTLYIGMNRIKAQELNEEIQRLVAINRDELPEKAKSIKRAMYSPGWVVEGAELKRQAESILDSFAEEGKAASNLSEQQKTSNFTSVMKEVSAGYNSIALPRLGKTSSFGHHMKSD